MDRKHYAFFLKKNRKTNPVAKDLSDDRYHQRVVKDKKIYNRKKYSKVQSKIISENSND